ncbi:ABC transporter ATP-binding protein [Acidovorax sp. CCYZU-2555]|uniref:ATP-binding cassette domain-containing protein n=1 Tax=Acidovorax sp. CCYZU-2555 TaxID=2835042 RepID=UPI001BCD3583|nr:ABC transporter ATP-binding protein [Acidovorax sp. CCYZU-2555]
MNSTPYAFIWMIVNTGGMRARLALSFLATAIHISSLLAQPVLIAQIIRETASPLNANAHMRIFLLASAMGFSALMAYCVAMLNNSVLQDVRLGTKHLLYSSILNKPADFFRNVNEGSIESTVATASLAVRTIIHDCLGTIIRALFFIAFSAALIFSELPLYGLIFFAAALVYFCMAYFLARRSAQAIVSAVTATTHVSREASDILANMEAIHGNDMGEHEKKRLLSFLNIERDVYRKGQGLIDSNEFLQKIFLTSIFIAFVISVSPEAKGDAATAIMLYIIGLLAYTQLDLVGKSLNSLFEQAHKLDAVLSKISFQDEYQATKEGAIRGKNDLSIKVNNISFSYKGGTPIFSDISAVLAPGSRHIISGESGAGKSTLLNTISGQLQPTSGQVLLGGVDIFSISLAEKSRLMSIIPQNVTLFNRSIYENATYGVQNISYQRLEELLLSLQLDRLQREGPAHWLDATVDKSGLNLSGGERQRLLLARAILRARPLLFLDESTSALDKETEAAVLRVLHERLPHTTIVAVSHHPHAELAAYRRIALA